MVTFAVLPLAVLTLTVVLPAFLAVTTPLEDTPATAFLLEDQVSLLSALTGDSVATSCTLSPTFMVNALLRLSVTLVGLPNFLKVMPAVLAYSWA